MKFCYKCNTEWTEDNKPGFREICTKCGSDIHCCLNCTFYDSKMYDNCKEPIAEKVTEADANNFCSYFIFIDRVPSNINKKGIDSKDAFNNLFK